MSGDKLKFLSKDLQEAKNNHLHLRDEISKEFRKTYKRIGSIDKEIDLIKYRQTMAVKKVSNNFIYLLKFLYHLFVTLRKNLNPFHHGSSCYYLKT